MPPSAKVAAQSPAGLVKRTSRVSRPGIRARSASRTWYVALPPRQVSTAQRPAVEGEARPFELHLQAVVAGDAAAVDERALARDDRPGRVEDLEARGEAGQVARGPDDPLAARSRHQARQPRDVGIGGVAMEDRLEANARACQHRAGRGRPGARGGRAGSATTTAEASGRGLAVPGSGTFVGTGGVAIGRPRAVSRGEAGARPGIVPTPVRHQCRGAPMTTTSGHGEEERLAPSGHTDLDGGCLQDARRVRRVSRPHPTDHEFVGGAASLRWSPDGTLLIVNHHYYPGTWLIDPAGGPVRQAAWTDPGFSAWQRVAP